MISDGVIIAIVSTVGGIIIAYITNVVAKRVQANRVEKQPKDRFDQMFDGYERLIRQLNVEDDRKSKLIKSLQANVSTLENELSKTRDTLNEVSDQFEISNSEVQSLKKIVYEMRTEYKALRDASKSA